MSATVTDRPRATETAGRPGGVDEWTRMETHLVIYKASRLLDEVSKHLAGFRARNDGTSHAARVADIAQQIDGARSELRDLRNEL